MKVHRKLLKWLECDHCRLSKYRRQVVLGKGVLPCDVLIIGEAPGKMENLLGEPFIGRSGKLLRTALKRAQMKAGLGAAPSMFITNVCACRPTNSVRGPNREPKDREVLACRPRLSKTIELAQAKIILLLGKVAENEVGALCPTAIALRHPAYLLRRGGVSGSEYKKFVNELAKAFRENLG